MTRIAMQPSGFADQPYDAVIIGAGITQSEYPTIFHLIRDAGTQCRHGKRGIEKATMLALGTL